MTQSPRGVISCCLFAAASLCALGFLICTSRMTAAAPTRQDLGPMWMALFGCLGLGFVLSLSGLSLGVLAFCYRSEHRGIAAMGTVLNGLAAIAALFMGLQLSRGAGG